MESMKSNITLEEYINIVEKVKSAIHHDLESFGGVDMRDPENPTFSVLSVEVGCSGEKDFSQEIRDYPYELFSRFEPDLMRYIMEKSLEIHEDYADYDDDESFDELYDNLYWVVSKYTTVNGTMCRVYTAYFHFFLCNLLGASWDCWLDTYPEELIPDFDLFCQSKLSDAQLLLLDSYEQLHFPRNVELPYQPGDILYIDACPFGKPIYAVYCAENEVNSEQPLRRYGYYEREHICLHISGNHNDLDLSFLASSVFAGVSFPYAPLDRIEVVETCDNPLLMKASVLLKEDPNRFYTWGAHKRENPYESWEHLISSDSEKK